MSFWQPSHTFPSITGSSRCGRGIFFFYVDEWLFFNEISNYTNSSCFYFLPHYLGYRICKTQPNPFSLLVFYIWTSQTSFKAFIKSLLDNITQIHLGTQGQYIKLICKIFLFYYVQDILFSLSSSWWRNLTLVLFHLQLLPTGNRIFSNYCKVSME